MIAQKNGDPDLTPMRVAEACKMTPRYLHHLFSDQDETVARYALEGLPNKVMAADYRMALPDEDELAQEIQRSQGLLENRAQYRT